MKIATSYYQLKSCNEGSAIREGNLLQITFKDGSIGYTDCHPWREFGDVSLEVQMQLLACGHLTPLLKRSLTAAWLDADARKAKRNLFHTIEIPKSHHHLGNITASKENMLFSWLNKPSQTVKMKVGFNLAEEINLLKSWSKELIRTQARIRFDFNMRITESAFIQFIDEIKDLKDCIDYCEDPFPYHQKKWKRAKEITNLAFASDLDSLQALSYTDSCDFLVVKPAIQDLIPFLYNRNDSRKLIITSYADHPIGQLHAAYIAYQAMQRKGSFVGLSGLLTHLTYEMNDFSKELRVEDCQLIPSKSGYGWGYDELLDDLNWKPLC